MHLQKNFFEALLGTLLHVKGKTKDGVKVRKDMVEMKIRERLAPEQRGTKVYLPPACYTLSREEKLKFCSFLASVKVPSGYSSNIKSLVNMKELKLVNMKSHDCHVMMHTLLPVALRGILPYKVRKCITKLCAFFGNICAKVLDEEELDILQEAILDIISELEIYFPPSFFDVMVHLTVHLIYEIKQCGPVNFTWMFPYERDMKVLKGYVRNRSRPEGCIVEGYVANEVIAFYSSYLGDTPSVGLPDGPTLREWRGVGKSGGKMITPNFDDLNMAHLFILQNCSYTQTYVEEHLRTLRSFRSGRSEAWVTKEHNNTFRKWFEAKVLWNKKNKPSDVNVVIEWLAYGPKRDVLAWQSYDVNGYSFYTKTLDNCSANQNSGVKMIANTICRSSAKDKNPVAYAVTYYGVIEEIWEVDYVGYMVALFKCKWVDLKHVSKPDEFGVIQLNLNKSGWTEEPFTMAEQVHQVFYVDDPAYPGMSIVLPGKRKYTKYSDSEFNVNDVEDMQPVAKFIPSTIIPNVDDDDECVRVDHQQGVLVNKGDDS